MRYRHSPDQVEFLLAIIGVTFFAAVWLPLIEPFARGAGPWVEIPLASLPVLLFIAVLVVYWRRFH